MAQPSRGNLLDDKSKVIIYEGANMSELEIILGMDARDIKKRIHGIAPAGARRGVPIYKLADIISRVYEPTEDELMQIVMNSSHHILPVGMTKEFWAGLRSKQEYELKKGDLWPTAKVSEEISKLFKIIKMPMLLMADTVDREMALQDEQRAAIKRITDNTLKELYKAIIELFSKKEPVEAVSNEEL